MASSGQRTVLTKQVDKITSHSVAGSDPAVTLSTISDTRLGYLYDHYKNSIARLTELVHRRNLAFSIFFLLQFGIFIFAINSELVFNLINGVLSKTYNITLSGNAALVQSGMWLAALFYVVQFVQLSRDVARRHNYLQALEGYLTGYLGALSGLKQQQDTIDKYQCVPTPEGAQQLEQFSNLEGLGTLGYVHQQDLSPTTSNSRTDPRACSFLNSVLQLFYTKISLLLPMLFILYLVVRELFDVVWWSLFVLIDLASGWFIEVVLVSYFLDLNSAVKERLLQLYAKLRA